MHLPPYVMAREHCQDIGQQRATPALPSYCEGTATWNFCLSEWSVLHETGGNLLASCLKWLVRNKSLKVLPFKSVLSKPS
jgi:hypothetical protein